MVAAGERHEGRSRHDVTGGGMTAQAMRRNIFICHWTAGDGAAYRRAAPAMAAGDLAGCICAGSAIVLADLFEGRVVRSGISGDDALAGFEEQAIARGPVRAGGRRRAGCRCVWSDQRPVGPARAGPALCGLPPLAGRVPGSAMTVRTVTARAAKPINDDAGYFPAHDLWIEPVEDVS